MTAADKSALPAKPDSGSRTKVVDDSSRTDEVRPSPGAPQLFSLPWNSDQALAMTDEQANAMLDRMIGAAMSAGLSPAIAT